MRKRKWHAPRFIISRAKGVFQKSNFKCLSAEIKSFSPSTDSQDSNESNWKQIAFIYSPEFFFVGRKSPGFLSRETYKFLGRSAVASVAKQVHPFSRLINYLFIYLEIRMSARDKRSRARRKQPDDDNNMISNLIIIIRMGGSKEGRQQNADKKVRKVVLSEDRSGRREDKSNERQKLLAIIARLFFLCFWSSLEKL